MADERRRGGRRGSCFGRSRRRRAAATSACWARSRISGGRSRLAGDTPGCDCAERCKTYLPRGHTPASLFCWRAKIVLPVRGASATPPRPGKSVAREIARVASSPSSPSVSNGPSRMQMHRQ